MVTKNPCCHGDGKSVLFCFLWREKQLMSCGHDVKGRAAKWWWIQYIITARGSPGAHDPMTSRAHNYNLMAIKVLPILLICHGVGTMDHFLLKSWLPIVLGMNHLSFFLGGGGFGQNREKKVRKKRVQPNLREKKGQRGGTGSQGGKSEQSTKKQVVDGKIK